MEYWAVFILIAFSFVMLAITIFNYNEDKKIILKSRLECYADVVAKSSSLEEAELLLPEDISAHVLGGDEPYEDESLTIDGGYVYFVKKYDNAVVKISQVYGDEQRAFMFPEWTLMASIVLLLFFSVFTFLCISRRYKKLEILKKEKDRRKLMHEMTRNISHELKTPVSSLQGYLETVVNHPDMDDERRQLYVERAFLQSLKLADIITDISTVTKLEETPGQYKISSVNLKVLCDGIIDEFSVCLRAHGIEVINELDPVSIKANNNLMYAIFRNLIENTIKYGGDGCSVKLSSTMLPDGGYEIDYHDTGRGVPDNQLEKIFDRFYRLNSDRASGKNGSGLGLSIIRNAVLAHKGSICAYNVPEGGLGFRFTLKDLQ